MSSHAGCNHDHAAAPKKVDLRPALVITGAVFFLEFAGGFWSGSLALLSDSLHVLFDAVALGLAWAATVLASRPATDRHSWGLHRSEILAALINGVALILVSAGIFVEAVRRLMHPTDVHTGGMLVIALIGLVANAIVARQLHGHDGEDLNMRGAYLHILGDLLASVAVIVGAVVIRYTGWTVVDPILSLGIGLLLLSGAGRLVRESLHILMEGVPRGLSVEQIVAAVREVPGVKDLHKVHVWSLCSHIRALAAHLTIDPAYSATAQQVIDDVNIFLREKFNITHTTLQSECNSCGAAGAICTPVHPGDAVPVHTHAVAAA